MAVANNRIKQTISFKLDPADWQEFTKIAKQRGARPRTVIREMVERHIDQQRIKSA